MSTWESGSSGLIRHTNDRAVLEQLFQHGRLTRRELVRLAGFSKPTASHVIARLRRSGLVTVAGHSSGGPGPRADIYALSSRAGFPTAVSIQEPDTAVTTIGDLHGHPLARRQYRLADEPLEAIGQGLSATGEDAGVDAAHIGHIHVALPGSYDARADTVRHIDVPGLPARGLRAQLSTRLRADVHISNDVNLATVAERHHGLGGDSGFALLWWGERGIGVGIDLGDDFGGRTWTGFRGAAGEIGYLPMGPVPSDEHQLQEHAGGQAVRRLLDTDDPAAAAVSDASREQLTRIAGHIAPGLVAVMRVLDPARWVLAGEIGRAGGERLAAALAGALRDWGAEAPVQLTAVRGDPVLRGALDAAQRTQRESILDHGRSSPGFDQDDSGGDEADTQQ